MHLSEETAQIEPDEQASLRLQHSWDWQPTAIDRLPKGSVTAGQRLVVLLHVVRHEIAVRYHRLKQPAAEEEEVRRRPSE